MFVLVPLDRVQMNPWQPRQHHDEAHIAALAADIKQRADTKPDTLGLLQLPAGRIVGSDGRTPVTIEGWRGINFSDALIAQDAWVQLAFGHSRFRAFCLLAKEDKRFARLPVERIAWDDEEMATSAWSENEARSALNPLEKAMALQRYMADFGWTPQDLGERLKLDHSTIANKLRLLKLAPDAQQLLATGALSERQAQALVALADLPPQALARAEKEWEKPSKLFADAPTLSSDAIRDRVHRVVNVATKDLKLAVFPRDQDVGAVDVVSPACTTCPIRVRRGDEQRCPDDGCWERKAEAWKAQQLAAASAVLGGLPVVDSLVSYAARTSLGDEIGATIQQQGCERLHLQWNEYSADGFDGFPHCRLVCVHGDGRSAHCACAKRLHAEREAANPEEQARKEQTAAAQALIDQSVQAVLAALVANEIGVWRALAAKLDYQLDMKKAAALDFHTCQQAVARCIVEREVYVRPDVDKVRDGLATILDAMAVPRPWLRPTLADVEKKLARIEGWIAGWDTAPLTADALRGNEQNLWDLFEQVPARAPGVDQVGARIMSAQVTIREMLQQHEDVDAQTIDAPVSA